MLTVIQTLPSLDFGGVERGTLEVAEELVKRGHRSIVISAGGRLVQQLTEKGSEHIELPIGKKSPFTFRYIHRLRNIIQQNDVDIVHARSRLPAWISYLACRGMSLKNRPAFITTVHGQYSVNLYSSIMTYGDRVIAISEFIRSYILENYPDTPSDKITVIQRGIDPESFPYGFKPSDSWIRSWNDHYPGLMNKILITLPGRVSRRKGHDDFLRIIAGLRKLNVDIHGLIAGGAGPGKQNYDKELKTKASLLGIDKNVTHLGHRDDIREIMSISNIIMSLSNEPEAFGRTVLEPVSIGVPVIAYDHGGAAEILRTLFPEGLVEEGNIDAVIARVIQFLQSSPRVPDTNPYTLRRMLDSTLLLYSQAAAKPLPHTRTVNT